MKIINSLLLLLTLLKVTYSQPLIFPNFPSDPINDLNYINSNEIIFTNNAGCIYKSNDAGNTWQRKAFFPGLHFNHINFINTNTGFALTDQSNDFVYSNDRGDTWHKQQLTLSDAITTLPFSERIIIKSSSDGNILRLDNYYDRWDTVYHMTTFKDSSIIIVDRLAKSTGHIFRLAPYGNITKIKNLPNGNVVALGNNRNAFEHKIIRDSLSYLLISKDSCLTWNTLWIGSKQFFKDFYISDNKTGWMISDTSLYKTSDSGITWNSQTKITGIHYYTSLFANGQNVYLLTSDKLIKSSDFGLSWIDASGLTETNVTSVNFNDNINGFLWGYNLYKTATMGQTWTRINPYAQNNIYDLDFISTKVGIAIGNNGVYKTYDGGNSWFNKFKPEGLISDVPGSLKMQNNSVGWVVTQFYIYKTEDGGENWRSISLSEVSLWFNKIAFCNEKIGVITFSEESVTGSHNYDVGGYFITTDGGINWIKRLPKSKTFDKLKFTDPHHLWGINQSGMWVSYDTAATWKKIYGGDYFIGPWSFDFADSLYGVVTISGDQAFLTTDGGKSWKAFNKPVGNDPKDCKILGQYVTGSQRILETGNDGKILSIYIYPNGIVEESYQLPTFTGMTLNKIDVLVDNNFPYVWVGGNGFSIWYRQFEKIITDVNQNNSVPTSFTLSQNYPNPFNPSTKIKYQIANSGRVTLKIYDLLGREVSTLVNETKPAGNYEVKFDGSSLTSGVYFYRMQCNSFIETKKFILMK